MAWNVTDEEYEYLEIISKKLNKAMFDSRVFSIPKEEVCNCLIWRQQDATRNSIESVGQANFSSKELHKKIATKFKKCYLHKKESIGMIILRITNGEPVVIKLKKQKLFFSQS